MQRDHITAAVRRLEPRGDWYDSPADFRAGLRCLAAELVAHMERPDAEGDSPGDGRESFRAS